MSRKREVEVAANLLYCLHRRLRQRELSISVPEDRNEKCMGPVETKQTSRGRRRLKSSLALLQGLVLQTRLRLPEDGEEPRCGLRPKPRCIIFAPWRLSTSLLPNQRSVISSQLIDS